MKGGFIGRRTSDRLDSIKMKVYNALNGSDLPGTLVLWKNSNLNKQSDLAVIEVWRSSERFAHFLRQILSLNSVDNRGKTIISCTHVGKNLCNAFWNGYLMVYGDGNLLKRLRPFYIDPMIVYHELAHSVIQYNFPLEYSGESGAINEHVADVLSVVAQHFIEDSMPNNGRWNPGSMIITDYDMSLRTFLNTKAYNYPELGEDEQVKHAKDFYTGEEDEGGVHINSGILNHAFYLFCMELGEHIWERPLKIWFNALIGIKPNCNFEDFAGRLARCCDELYGNKVLEMLIRALASVGIE